MTQQYLIGQLSALLEELQPPAGGELAGVVRGLRREVECSAPRMLARLAFEAIELSDVICLEALERGDCDGFHRYVQAAAAIGEFTENARITPE